MATPQEALPAALERWNAGDLEGYLSLYDEGIRLHGYSPEPMDKAQARASTRESSAPSARRSWNFMKSCGTARRAPSGSP